LIQQDREARKGFRCGHRQKRGGNLGGGKLKKRGGGERNHLPTNSKKENSQAA